MVVGRFLPSVAEIIERKFNKFHFWNPKLSPLQMEQFVDRLAAKGRVTFLELGGGAITPSQREEKKQWLNIENYISLDIQMGVKPDVVGDATALPFRDECFDAVSCLVVLEHISEPKELLRESYRVLRQGGVLLLVTPFLWEFHSCPADFFRYTHVGLEYLLKGAGFERIQIDTSTHGGLFYMLSLICFWCRPSRHTLLFNSARLALITLFNHLRRIDRYGGFSSPSAYSQLTALAIKDSEEVESHRCISQ